MENNIKLENSGIKIFLLKDPLLETKIDKYTDYIKLSIEYPFSTPLLFAFVFEINDVNLPYQKGYWINKDELSTNSNYSESAIKMFIKDKQMIYNGSYYVLING